VALDYRWAMAIVWVAVAVAIALFVGDPANRYEGLRLGAVQSMYRDGVPHTDRRGRLLSRYDPARSFFPIGIYHGLSGEFRGRHYGMAALRDAGFNTVHAWEGQDFGAMLAAAGRNGLQLIHHNPGGDDPRRGRGDPALLAWYLDEDPSIREWDPDWRARLDRFQARRAALRALDPDRVVLALDGPFIDPPRRTRWLAWNSAGDVSAHWNYPLRGAATKTLAGRRSIPQSVAAAVRLNQEKKPLWLVVQAFQSPYQDWRMPSARELRAMVYAGIVHGATGVLYFALDSFVTRDGQVVGVAPWTEESYGPSPDYDGDGTYPLVAAPELVAKSRALWRDIAALNKELAALAPDILSPTARLDYTVVGPDRAPVRTLLKRRGDEFTLFAVNLEAAPAALTVRFEVPLARLALKIGDGAAFQPGPSGWRDRLDGFGIRVYRFRLR
jgi:hypothetical protein